MNHSAAQNNAMAKKKLGSSQISCSVNLGNAIIETAMVTNRLSASLW
jgi:hypothetical protein